MEKQRIEPVNEEIKNDKENDKDFSDFFSIDTEFLRKFGFNDEAIDEFEKSEWKEKNKD